MTLSEASCSRCRMSLGPRAAATRDCPRCGGTLDEPGRRSAESEGKARRPRRSSVDRDLGKNGDRRCGRRDLPDRPRRVGASSACRRGTRLVASGRRQWTGRGPGDLGRDRSGRDPDPPGGIPRGQRRHRQRRRRTRAADRAENHRHSGRRRTGLGRTQRRPLTPGPDGQ